jgi:hypothetical protein
VFGVELVDQLLEDVTVAAGEPVPQVQRHLRPGVVLAAVSGAGSAGIVVVAAAGDAERRRGADTEAEAEQPSAAQLSGDRGHGRNLFQRWERS